MVYNQLFCLSFIEAPVQQDYPSRFYLWGDIHWEDRAEIYVVSDQFKYEIEILTFYIKKVLKNSFLTQEHQ